MSDTCGNPSCSVSRHRDNGKLFCAEIEISSATEVYQRKIAYVWLCDGCAQQMKPESAIVGDIIRALVAQASGAATAIASTVN
jgi:exosome complex RNA-binding protein Csl4